MGGLLFGFDIAVISGTIPFLKVYFKLSESGLGFVAGVLHIGCMVGALFTGYITDKFGRRGPLLASACIFAISSVATGLADSHIMILIARFIAGLAVGAASILSPMYIAEISPAKIRGRMVALNQLTIVLGILMAYYINFLMVHWDNNWRYMFISGAIPSGLFFLLLLFVPESPRWLAVNFKKEKALKVLKKISGEKEAEGELERIMKGSTTDVKLGISALFKPKVRRLVLIGIGLAIFQQFSGINTILFYGTEVFTKAGFSTESSLFQSVLIGLVNLVFTILSLWLVEKLGRKILMLVGSLLMAVFLIAISISFQAKDVNGVLLVVLILGYIATFATSSGPVTWVLISEIFPNKIRGLAMSVATVFLWLACFLLTFTFPVLLKKLNASMTYMIYAVICVITFFFVLFFIRETKGKNLEEIA